MLPRVVLLRFPLFLILPWPLLDIKILASQQVSATGVTEAIIKAVGISRVAIGASIKTLFRTIIGVMVRTTVRAAVGKIAR